MLVWLRSNGYVTLASSGNVPKPIFLEGLPFAKLHSEFCVCLLSLKPPTTTLQGSGHDNLHLINEEPETSRSEMICPRPYTSVCQSQDLSPGLSASRECPQPPRVGSIQDGPASRMALVIPASW